MDFPTTILHYRKKDECLPFRTPESIIKEAFFRHEFEAARDLLVMGPSTAAEDSCRNLLDRSVSSQSVPIPTPTEADPMLDIRLPISHTAGLAFPLPHRLQPAAQLRVHE
jgi:hypothetical protein